jgi:PAS domain S-box-containing protein
MFQVLADSVGEIGDIAVVTLTSDDGEWLDLAGLKARDPATLASLRIALARRPLDGASYAEVIRTGTPLFLASLAPDDLGTAAGHFSKEQRAIMKQVGTHAAIVVPLVLGGRVAGIVATSRNETKNPFTQSDFEAVRALAARAGILLDNARTHRDLREASARLETIIAESPIATVVLDAAHLVRMSNRASLDLFGWTAADVIGRELPMTPPDLESAELDLRRLMSDGQTVRGHETRVRRRDGSDVSVSLYAAPLHEAGKQTGTVLRWVDLSERRMLEKQLLQAQRLEGLEAAPDAMVVVNRDGEIVLVNLQAEKRFGYRRDELLGKPVTTIIPNGFAERLLADDLRSAEEALAQQIGTGIELVGRRQDASEFPIEIMLSPLRSADGILITAAIRDITVRKAAEVTLRNNVEELKRSNEELGNFAYIASHDLQEPLRMVASYTQLLAKRYKGKLDAEADEFIGFAVDGASRMQRLIEDLLSYSRVASTGVELVETSSQDALDHAMVNLREAIRDSGAVVTHDALPSVKADETQLVQLFQNLIGNAIKYQRPGIPLVHVGVARHGRTRWSFAVKDNGLGIEARYFERIFGMFQRLHKRDEFSGTGIGLAICKKIVERHGGSLSVESSPGEGSTFTFGLAGIQLRSGALALP